MNSKVIVLYNYNKYYNRIIKRKATFQEYLNLITAVGNTPAAYRGFVRENLNFDFSDGVYAKLVINIKKAEPQFAKIEQPDYLVLEETYVEGEGNSAVTTKRVSRWFVLEAVRIRGNQYELSLRRDLLADYYDKVTNTPVFIEKGWVNDIEDPALFNKESITVNQIKRGELLLNQHKYSGKGAGWVVGYIAKEEQKTAIAGCEAVVEPPNNVIDYDNLPTIIKNALTNHTSIFDMTKSKSVLTFSVLDPTDVYITRAWYNKSYQISNLDAIIATAGEGWGIPNSKLKYNYILYQAPNKATFLRDIGYALDEPETRSIPHELADYFEAYYGAARCNHVESLIESYHDTYILKDGQLYVLEFSDDGEYEYFKEYTNAQIDARSDSLVSKQKDVLNYLLSYNSGFSNNPNANQSNRGVRFSTLVQSYNVSLVATTENKITCDLPANRRENFDAPYDIFCIPIGSLDVKNNLTVDFTTITNIALPMARGIAIKGTTEKIYDIQILPYCPENDLVDSDGNIQIAGLTEHTDYEYIYRDTAGVTQKVGIIIFPSHCKGSFDITIPSNDPIYTGYLKNINNLDLDPIITKKVRSETQLIRFVSPNFSSVFEINAQKNNGIQTLNIDYFYKPYAPYIHVAPYFDGLYGQDFNDPKGLICSGDFSIATSSSQWEKYQIENKNYEMIFNRQIQNLDINNSIAYEQAAKASGINIATTALAGMGAGAVAGAMVGSAATPVGTLVGAGVGAIVGGLGAGIASAVGRNYDLEYLKKSQSEARSYAVDMYAYSLGNVQALPYALTRVSAFTPNNKIFPFIEVYDCTDTEKAALMNKLFYNGMTIMRIGYISEFLGYERYDYGRYVSGQLIRLTGIEEDSHVIAEIAQEIKEGAYFYGYDSEQP